MSRRGVPTDLDELKAKVRSAQLATLVKEAPRGAWIYELKWDGYRILAHKSGRKVIAAFQSARAGEHRCRCLFLGTSSMRR